MVLTKKILIYISTHLHQADSSGLVFYDQAIKTLWVQVVALTSASLGGFVMIVALEPRLWGAGWRTPILPIFAMVSIAKGMVDQVQATSMAFRKTQTRE